MSETKPAEVKETVGGEEAAAGEELSQVMRHRREKLAAIRARPML